MAKPKILVPIDFSENCRLSLAYVFDYLQHNEAEVFLFYVVENVMRTHFRGAADKLEGDLERMRDLLVNELERYQKQTGVAPKVGEVHRRIGNGTPYKAILKMASEAMIDIIVMGSSKTGKTATRVVEKAPCTTVVVKEKDVEFVMD